MVVTSSAVSVNIKSVLRPESCPFPSTVSVSPTLYPLPAVVTVTLVIRLDVATIVNIAPVPDSDVVVTLVYVPAVIA